LSTHGVTLSENKKHHSIAVIENALKYAEEKGWRVKINKRGHAWGRMFCPRQERGACIASNYSTPKVPENHAKQIIRRVDNCDHGEE